MDGNRFGHLSPSCFTSQSAVSGNWQDKSYLGLQEEMEGDLRHWQAVLHHWQAHDFPAGPLHGRTDGRTRAGGGWPRESCNLPPSPSFSLNDFREVSSNHKFCNDRKFGEEHLAIIIIIIIHLCRLLPRKLCKGAPRPRSSSHRHIKQYQVSLVLASHWPDRPLPLSPLASSI